MDRTCLEKGFQAFFAYALVTIFESYWFEVASQKITRITRIYKTLQEFRAVREVEFQNFLVIRLWYDGIELQLKFEVISSTDGDFRAAGVTLDGFCQIRAPESSNPI